jgi:hypothetical protein
LDSFLFLSKPYTTLTINKHCCIIVAETKRNLAKTKQKENKMSEKYINSTIGMHGNHRLLNKTLMIRVEFLECEEGVKLRAISGNNLSVIRAIPEKIISRERYDNRIYDSNTEIFGWACDLLDIETSVGSYVEYETEEEECCGWSRS